MRAPILVRSDQRSPDAAVRGKGRSPPLDKCCQRTFFQRDVGTAGDLAKGGRCPDRFPKRTAQSSSRVFSTVGGGVKTGFVFFTKGKKTQTIWYSGVVDLKEALKRLKKEIADEQEIEVLEARISKKEWAGRELEGKRASIAAIATDAASQTSKRSLLNGSSTRAYVTPYCRAGSGSSKSTTGAQPLILPSVLAFTGGTYLMGTTAHANRFDVSYFK
jgi:hypothetical protein